jgi:hypothetical protein
MSSHPIPANTGGSEGPRSRTPIVVAGAIVLGTIVIAASVLVGLVTAWSIARERSARSTGQIPAVTASAPPTVAPTTVPVPAGPAPAPMAGFTAGSFTGGAAVAGLVTSVGSVRAAAQSGYDRFVIDLGQSPLQRYEVRTQATPRFTLDPKGEVVTLDGARGVQIVLLDASNHLSYTGATDLHPSLPAIREAKLIGDFEGVVSWALGIDGPGFVRIMTLANPTRLVVDVQT